MKGYLERLVRTVTNPAESVHPWTGSVFDAGYQRDSRGVQGEELAPFAAAMQPDGTVSSDSAQSSQRTAPIHTSPPGADRTSLTSESSATQSALGSAADDEGADRGPYFRNRMIAQPLIATAEGTAARDLEMAPAKGPERTHPGYDPLVSAEALIKSGNAVELAVGAPHPSANDKNGRASRDSAAVDRQTDEIQIHIGRIEVTAVYPPVPAARKARDKEISLDAYLKRRDGRAV